MGKQVMRCGHCGSRSCGWKEKGCHLGRIDMLMMMMVVMVLMGQAVAGDAGQVLLEFRLSRTALMLNR